MSNDARAIGQLTFSYIFSLLKAAAVAEVLQHQYHNILTKVGLGKFFKWKFAKQRS